MTIMTVNGKEYLAKAFDFNTICDLEDMGISLEQMMDKPISMARAYFCMSSGLSPRVGGEQIQEHILGGGTLETILVAMSKEMEESDFFRNLTQNKAKETSETSSEEKTKKTTKK